MNIHLTQRSVTPFLLQQMSQTNKTTPTDPNNERQSSLTTNNKQQPGCSPTPAVGASIHSPRPCDLCPPRIDHLLESGGREIY